MFFLGICINIFSHISGGVGVFFSEFIVALDPTLLLVKGGYSVLGMMIIGIALSGLRIHHVNFQFLITGIFLRHVLVPLGMFFCVFFLFSSLLSSDIPYLKEVLLLQAFCPVAANIVVLSSLFKVEVERASMFLLTSTIFSLLTLPFLALLILSYS